MAQQSFFYPLLWPFINIYSLLTSAKPAKNVTNGTFNLAEHVFAMAASFRSALFAYICMFVLYNGYDYPAFGKAQKLELDWMLPILTRNIIGTWIICGGWDWILYFSPLKDMLHDFKMNPKYPPFVQLSHDAFYTTLSSVIAGIVEIGLCYCWANGILSMDKSLMDKPILNIILLATITHWRIPHFHLIHRGMHPWRTEKIPDFGKVAYNYVHALHHKSYNPTSFSGTSMHPIESSLYYSAALIPVVFGLHPLLSLGCIMDLATGAWLGHDGFQWPGSGDYFHFLHHKHFDCNYGAVHVPLDKFFGTFAGAKEEVSQIWRGKKVGEEHNDTPVHPDGQAPKLQ